MRLIGKITLDQGKLVELDFVDSYDIYRNDGVYPPAPTAMQQYMNIPLMLMRDANWSPDLPTAAKVARALYKSDTGVEIDGIVTVDLNAVKTIFDAKSGELLGAHMVGAEVTELIQGYVVGRALETTEEDLMNTVFPHPTLSEMMHEAVLDAYGRALHI